jgi:hypothetical protein
MPCQIHGKKLVIVHVLGENIKLAYFYARVLQISDEFWSIDALGLDDLGYSYPHPPVVLPKHLSKHPQKRCLPVAL